MPRKSLHRAVAEYSARYEQTQQLTDMFVADLSALIDEAGINYLSVSGRAKSPTSFADKIGRYTTARGHRRFEPELFDPHTEITDQVGVRVITYVQSDIEPIAAMLYQNFTVLEDRDKGQETAAAGRFGYASRHMLISRDPDATEYDPTQCASVQLRTVLQHAWAEFEHDARYKGAVPAEHAPELERRFTLAAGLIELADQEFSVIRDTLRRDARTGEVPLEEGRINPRDLASFLAGCYPDANFSRADQYVWASEILSDLGVASIEALRERLQGIDSEATMRSMGFRTPPGAIRRLDDDLLAAYREEYIALPANAPRVNSLRGRLQRLPSVAGPEL